MTTNDEVETLGAPGKCPVLFVTDVGHGDNPLGQPPLPDEVNGFLDGLGDVEEIGSGARAGDSGSGLRGDTDNCKVILLEDLVGLDVLHEIGVVALYVGANGWEGQVFQLELQVQSDEICEVASNGYTQIGRDGRLRGRTHGFPRQRHQNQAG